MAKPVAAKGDVKPTVSTQQVPAAATGGTWNKVGDVQYQSYAKLKAGNAEVIHTATCEFMYSGGMVGQSPAATVTVTVTLKGTGKHLQWAKKGVILDGDSAEDDKGYGNKLKASSSRKLKSG